MADDDALAKYDSLCREVYADTRVPPGTQEVILAMGWAMFRHPDQLNGSALWTEVRRMLRRDEIGRPRMWTLIAKDAPRYEPPRTASERTGTCEGPRLRPYQPRYRPEPDPNCIVYGTSSTPYDHTEGGRICGADASIRVNEADMVTGWVTPHWFCRRHQQRAREVKAQLAARGEPPPPIPNRGGLLPCYFTADWEKLYTKAVERAHYGPYRWEKPYYGLSADDWPVPGQQPIPRRPRLSIVAS